MVEFLFIVQFSYFLEYLEIWTIILLLKTGKRIRRGRFNAQRYIDTQIHKHLIQKSLKLPIHSSSQKQVKFYIVLFLSFYPFPKRNLLTN